MLQYVRGANHFVDGRNHDSIEPKLLVMLAKIRRMFEVTRLVERGEERRHERLVHTDQGA